MSEPKLALPKYVAPDLELDVPFRQTQGLLTLDAPKAKLAIKAHSAKYPWGVLEHQLYKSGLLDRREPLSFAVGEHDPRFWNFEEQQPSSADKKLQGKPLILEDKLLIGTRPLYASAKSADGRVPTPQQIGFYFAGIVLPKVTPQYWGHLLGVGSLAEYQSWDKFAESPLAPPMQRMDKMSFVYQGRIEFALLFRHGADTRLTWKYDIATKGDSFETEHDSMHWKVGLLGNIMPVHNAAKAQTAYDFIAITDQHTKGAVFNRRFIAREVRPLNNFSVDAFLEERFDADALPK